MNDEHLHSFKNLFKKYLKEEHLDQKFDQKKLAFLWTEIMGKTIGSRTKNIFFRDKTLIIELSSAPLKNELHQSKTLVMQKLYEHFDKSLFDDIRFI